MSKKKEAPEQPELEKEQEEQAREPEKEQEQNPPEPTADEKLTEQLKEEQDRYLRLMAEFDNFRRRTQKEKENAYMDAKADTVKELLPLLDNFGRAMEATCADEEYKKGIQMTYSGFLETLKKLGLVEFGESGDAFDPNLHNAVMHVDDEGMGKNVVAQVFQRGYKLGERVLRYAMVQQAN